MLSLDFNYIKFLGLNSCSLLYSSLNAINNANLRLGQGYNTWAINVLGVQIIILIFNINVLSMSSIKGISFIKDRKSINLLELRDLSNNGFNVALGRFAV